VPARILKVLLLVALALMIGSLRSSVAPSPPENLEIGEPAPTDDVGEIHAIEASPTGEVWAVGETLSKPTKGFVARWDGTEWKNEATLSIAGGDHSLHDIAIVSQTDMWVVGQYSAGPKTAKPLIAHWDGADWKVVTGIDTGPGNSGLRTITAVAPDDIWVGGWYNQEGRSPEARSIILHWDGKAWGSFPPPANAKRYIDDMSAVSTDDVWAVAGNSIIHWDGTSWSEAYTIGDRSKPWSAPNFMGVEALSEQDVWVVGYSLMVASCDYGSAHILHWDGHTWASVPYPPVGGYCAGPPGLVDIHALASNDIWAVGTALYRPMDMHWDGKTWSLTTCPDVGLSGGEGFGGLAGVTGAKGKIWIAGSRTIRREESSTSNGPAFLTQPFIMHPYRGVCPTPTPLPTPVPQPPTFVPPTMPEVPGPVRTDLPRPVQTAVAPDAVATTISVNRTATAFVSTQTRSVPPPGPTPPVP
jgi:hypothetical protein